jgi:hypothetical protein
MLKIQNPLTAKDAKILRKGRKEKHALNSDHLTKLSRTISKRLKMG